MRNGLMKWLVVLSVSQSANLNTKKNKTYQSVRSMQCALQCQYESLQHDFSLRRSKRLEDYKVFYTPRVLLYNVTIKSEREKSLRQSHGNV